MFIIIFVVLVCLFLFLAASHRRSMIPKHHTHIVLNDSMNEEKKFNQCNSIERFETVERCGRGSALST